MNLVTVNKLINVVDFGELKKKLNSCRLLCWCFFFVLNFFLIKIGIVPSDIKKKKKIKLFFSFSIYLFGKIQILFKMNLPRPANWWYPSNPGYAYPSEPTKMMELYPEQNQCFDNGYNLQKVPDGTNFGVQQIPQNYSNQGFYPEQMAIYPPCQGPQPWNYAYCYGYYGEEPCPYVNVVDMEDFM